VVLLVGVAGHLLGAILAFFDPRTAQRPAWELWTTHLVQSVQILAVMALVIWRSGRPWRDFGIVRPRPVADLAFAVLMVVLMLGVNMSAHVVLAWLESFVPSVEDWVNIVPPSHHSGGVLSLPGGWTLAVFLPAQLANGLSEELVGRGYLIPRLTQALGSVHRAVLAQAMLLASYHIYQGSEAVLVIMVGEVMVGYLFVALRRIWPLALGHALYDLVALLGRG
jgi:membrane protease YdiL (CAAX protease family)